MLMHFPSADPCEYECKHECVHVCVLGGGCVWERERLCVRLGLI